MSISQTPTPQAIVIGGGLAGSEAAWQIAKTGLHVHLYEMRPQLQTGAHQTDQLAELVCSNSLGSILPDRASGVLKSEMEKLDSLILKTALAHNVPAGGALAVDRERFAENVTQTIESHPKITLIRKELPEIPLDTPCVIASGPLTSEKLSTSIANLTEKQHLYFYDALAPIVEADSIDMDTAFRASRYEKGVLPEGDYINCPLNKEEYLQLHQALLHAPRIELKAFENEKDIFFENCLPVEILASRGVDSLAYGPMRPKGLRHPRTGKTPYAVVQLRQDNVAATLYNLVGFQTNIRWGEQTEILRMIPGLQNAEFIRMGQMHRNTFINSPSLLTPALQLKSHPQLYFAGQITGVEGYMGNAATGLLAGLNLARTLHRKPPLELPRETMLGALCWYITHAEAKHFQPMKANFGILPPFDPKPRNKRERYAAYARRAAETLENYLTENLT